MANKTNTVINVLDLMKPEEKEKLIKRYKARVARNDDYENRISNEIFLISEFGYYYGWEAVQAVRNNEISFTQMYALLEGARKVWYSKLVETAKVQATAVATPLSKNPNQTFQRGMKPFIKASKIEGSDNG